MDNFDAHDLKVRERQSDADDLVDRGDGGIITPVAGGSWSSRGKCVHLPVFNMPSSGVLDVWSYQVATVLARSPVETEAAPQQVLSFSVPNGYGLRLTHMMAHPRELSLWPYCDAMLQVQGQSVMGYDRRANIGNGTTGMELVSIFVPGGKTLVIMAINRVETSLDYAAAIRGYLFIEKGSA